MAYPLNPLPALATSQWRGRAWSKGGDGGGGAEGVESDGPYNVCVRERLKTPNDSGIPIEPPSGRCDFVEGPQCRLGCSQLAQAHHYRGWVVNTMSNTSERQNAHKLKSLPKGGGR